MRVIAAAPVLVVAPVFPSSAQQLPTGGAVAAGNVAIGAPHNGTLNINQGSNQAIINWNTFSVGVGGTVNFNQPGASSATLNRVTSSTPSSIAGTINAPGTVMLVNPNGIAITKTSVINTGSFVASTLGIKNEDFLAGKYHFQGNGASAPVTNRGHINVSDGGFAALLGGRVANHGVINAKLGKVGLGSGEVATIDLSGDGFMSVAVPSNQVQNLRDGHGRALVTNTGKINANGGTVVLSAATAKNALQQAVNVPGSIRANSVGVRGGKIVLNGGDGGIVNVGGTLAANGGKHGNGGSIAVAGAKISVPGKIAANGRKGGHIAVTSAGSLAVAGKVSAKGRSGQGGAIDLAGNNIRLTGAKVNASGATGGGLVRVGGAFRGGRADPSDPLYQAYVARWGALPSIAAATTVTVDSATKIDVSARKTGDAGTAVIWSNENTSFAGTIVGTGGSKSGDGGYAEVSGKQLLDFSGRVNLKASVGASGTLLLDPSNLTISTGTTTNETSSGGNPNTFSPTNSAANSVLNTTDLQNALASANVVATTNGTITVANPVTWSNSNSLTLQTTTVTGNSANITINAAITASNGTLILSSNGNTISQGASGDISVANLSLLGTSAAATLNNAGNQIGTLAANTASVSLTNNLAGGLVLGTSTVTGNLTVVNKLGNLTQSGALTVGGTSSFTTSATDATVTLTSANALTGAASLNTSGTNGNASLTNNQATVLGTSNVGGNLTVVSTVGNLTQTGALTVAGTSSFTTSANNATITLTNTGNLLTGAASLNTSGTSGNGSLTNNKATVLGDSNVGGNLLVTDRVGNLTQTGVLTVGGTSSFTTSTANATITLTNASNALTGAVTLSTSGGTSGDASLTNNVATTLAASSIGRNLVIIDQVGNLTQTGVLTVGGTSSLTTSAADATITLTSANLLTGAASFNTSGTGGNASLTNARATVLGASNVGGNLTVTDTANSLTQTGALTVAGTSSFTTSANNATITLTNASNALSGAITLSTTGTTADASLTNNVATALAASSIGRNLTITDSVGNLTQTGALTVGGTSSFTTSASNATITLNNANLLTGAASLNTSGTNGNATLTNAKATVLGASNVGGNLIVTDTVGNLTQIGALTVAGTSSFTTSATNATITLTNAGNLLTGAAVLNTSGATGNASLTNAKATDLGASTVGGNLTVIDSVGNLTQSGVLTVGGTSSFTTSASNATITLNNANLLTGAASLNTSGASGNANLVNAKATVLGASNVGGNLTVTDTVGNLTQTAALTVAGTSSFTTSATDATITLTNTGNLLTGAASLNTSGTGGNASLTNNKATVLGDWNVGGNVVVTDRVGNLTQSGVLTVGGTSSFTTAANNATITLTNTGNALSGAIALSTTGATSGDASLTNNVATALAASTIGRNLVIIDRIGNLTQTGVLTVTGTSSFTTLATDATITLTSANLLTGAASLNTSGTGGNVSLTNAKATVLGASNVGGNLTVTDMVGSVTQNGALTVAGTSSFTTSTNNADITLTNAGNLLSGTVSLNTTGGTGNASLTNAKATDLGASTVGGNLTVTDSVGNLTQSGALTVGGTSSFTTSASSATITLNNANLLTGAASLNTSGASGNASLINAKATVLGASNVGGNLTVTDTVGNLTQTGVLTVAGTSSFTTSATDATITLTNAGNLLTGAASLNTSGTGGNASLTNNKATVLGDWNVGGNLVVTDQLGNLTQSGVLTVGGTSSFTTSASNATITLTNAGNLLTGAVSLNTSGASGNASLTNASATVLGASTVGGNLTVQTDSISVSGAVNASGQTVTFVPLTSTTAMTLGAAGGLALSQTSLDNITASTLVFGSTGSTGGITVGGPVTLATTGITNLSLITTGDITVNNPITVNNGANATLTLNTTGTATQSAAITAANLALLGTGGSYTLNNSGNLIATVAVNTGSVNLTTSEAVTIGTVGGTTGWTTTGNSTLTATGSTSDITVSNAVNWGNSSLLLDAGRNVAINAAMTGGSAGDLTALANGNLTIGAAGVITGKTVALSAIGAFINNRGSNAVSASDRWLVYSNAPDAPGENFGNLNSNNTAIWNNTYATLPPSSVTVPGNRYIFAFAPGSTPAALTVTSLNDSKTYGDTANLSLFTVSGFQAGVANAYLADPNVYSGTPGFFSAGAAAAANAGAYPIIVSQGTLAASGGYSFAFNNTGVLTANPKALTITANNVTQAFSNVPFSGGNGVIYNGLANGQNPSALSGTIMYGGTSQGAVNVGTYSIIPSGQTSSNYAITYVNGTLTITPLPMSVVLDALGAAANAAGTTAPSLTMNATILPTSPFSLPGNVAPFGGNSVLPYGNDTGAAGSSTNQQTSNTSGGSTNQQSSNTSDSRRRRREAR